MTIPLTKRCKDCLEPKDLSDFHKCAANKDGLNSKCKSCVKEHYEANKERIAAYQKKYLQANRESKQEYIKQYCETNKESISEHKKQYYKTTKETDPERYKQYSKTYWEANKARINSERASKRRSTKTEQQPCPDPNSHTDEA